MGKMRIASSTSAFNPSEGETAVFHAIKELTLTASTREGAEFLARLHAAIRRGQPDQALVELVERLERDRT